MADEDKGGESALPQDGRSSDRHDDREKDSDREKDADTGIEGTELEQTHKLSASRQSAAGSIDNVTMPKSLGRYEIRRFLGRGAYGAVYLGYDPKLNRDVAIKVPLIREDLTNIEKEFLAEAQRLAQLHHHGIVSVFDVGFDAGLCYIVSEYLQGKGLNVWLKDNSPAWQETVKIVAAIADALAHAHAQSTIHRDVKPGNVILVNEADGIAPKLVDFGLAIAESNTTGENRGVVSGTPAYMSPEQIRGLAHRIDGRTDLYSLGVVLYEMLCGRRPFRAENNIDELLRQVREDAPQPPRQVAHGIPSKLEDICLRALSKKENDRFKTAGDMSTALRGLLASDAVPEPDSETELKQEKLRAAEVATAGSGSTATNSTIRRAREAQRRQLTVMICNCDTSDPEQSLAALDPEDQRDVLEEFRRVCEDVINRYGGTIVQASGQELLICFGYPIAFEDAPHRAVRTGLGILEEMQLLNDALKKQKKTTLSAWAAIHTGIVVAGETSIGESADTLTIIGEARTVASRLEALTEREQIIISDATHRLVQGFFFCESQGTQKIRGVPNPVELFQVQAEITEQSRVELVDPANLTPLVGRDMELGIITDRWEHAVEGMGQVVLLIGEAGLGKSRMVRELKQHVANENTESAPYVIEWRCSAYHTGSSLFPAKEFFERLLGLQRDDTPQMRLDKLVSHLQELKLDAPDNVAIFASLLSIPPDSRCAPIGLSPVRQKERTQDLLLEWLHEYSATQPVLFIVEDLHWVDPTTLEFLTLLVEQGSQARVLTLLSFRPDFRMPWQQAYSHLTQVALTRLTKRQIGEMIRRQSGVENIPDEIVAKLADRTDGVPLFVEEFTRIIEESGVLAAERKGEDITLALNSIPVTLQDLLTARLDRLDSDPAVVQLGAVFGREFTYELLNAATELEDEKELQAELTKLVEAELLFQKGRPPKSSYIFKHALIQDAAYNSLLKKKRQQYHKRIAETFENRFDDTSETEPELLAHHFTEAGEDEKAIQYWLKAGQQAQQRWANAEAISHLTRGLEVLDGVEESPSRDQLELGFQLTLAPVLMAARGWSAPEVGTAIERAQQLVAGFGSLEDRFFVMWGLWGWRLIRADMDICQPIADEMLQMLKKSEEGDSLLSEAYWCVGSTAYYKGDFKSGVELLEKGLTLIDEEKERLYALKTGQCCSVLCRSHIALALWQLGFPDQALQRSDEMVRLAKEIEHPFSYAMALFFRRQVLQFCGLDDKARDVIEQEYKVCHENGFVFFEVHAIFARGVSLLNKRKTDEARHQFELGSNMLHATGGNLSMDHPYRNIAEAFLSVGLLDDASEWLERGFDLVNNRNERGMESDFLRLQGELKRAAGDEESAETFYLQALEVSRKQEARSWELRAMTSFAMLKQSQGKQNEAHESLKQTCDLFNEGFDSTDLKKAKSLLEELNIDG